MTFPREKQHSKIIPINSEGHDLSLLAARPFLSLLKASQKEVGKTMVIHRQVL